MLNQIKNHKPQTTMMLNHQPLSALLKQFLFCENCFYSSASVFTPLCQEPQTATVVTSLGSSQPSAAAAFDTASTGMPMVFKTLGMMEEILLLSATNPDSLAPSPWLTLHAMHRAGTFARGNLLPAAAVVETTKKVVVPVKTTAKVVPPAKSTAKATVVKPTVPVKTTAKVILPSSPTSLSLPVVSPSLPTSSLPLSPSSPTLPSSSSTLPTTTSSLPSSSTTSLPAATKSPVVKSVPKPSSSSPSPSITPSSAASVSTIAAAIVSSIVGLGLAIAGLLIAFVLGRWNRQRRARARESGPNNLDTPKYFEV
ncbi:hypothetical protein C8F01DRAFT_1090599 [Mycena amicta]|nr:hypothetical protein C8F01DRAFT_1090599 [Mycena amicta]